MNCTIKYGNDFYFDGGAILILARRTGRISPILDGANVSYLRNLFSGHSHKEREENFISLVRRFAAQEEEAEKYRQQFGAYMKDALEARRIQERKLLGEPVSDAESDKLSKFEMSRLEIIRGRDHLYTLTQHLIENGDLPWLWGINDEDNLDVVGHKSDGGRVGDLDDKAW